MPGLLLECSGVRIGLPPQERMILGLSRARHTSANWFKDLRFTQVRNEETEYEATRRGWSGSSDIRAGAGPPFNQPAPLKLADCTADCNPGYSKTINQGCFAREFLSGDILATQNFALESVRQLLVFRTLSDISHKLILQLCRCGEQPVLPLGHPKSVLVL